MSQEISTMSHVKGLLVINTIILICYIGYEQTVYFTTGHADPGALIIIELGATALNWFFWFYFVPKSTFNFFYKIIAFVRGQHEPEAK